MKESTKESVKNEIKNDQIDTLINQNKYYDDRLTNVSAPMPLGMENGAEAEDINYQEVLDAVRKNVKGNMPAAYKISEDQKTYTTNRDRGEIELEIAQIEFEKSRGDLDTDSVESRRSSAELLKNYSELVFGDKKWYSKKDSDEMIQVKETLASLNNILDGNLIITPSGEIPVDYIARQVLPAYIRAYEACTFYLSEKQRKKQAKHTTGERRRDAVKKLADLLIREMAEFQMATDEASKKTGLFGEYTVRALLYDDSLRSKERGNLHAQFEVDKKIDGSYKTVENAYYMRLSDKYEKSVKNQNESGHPAGEFCKRSDDTPDYDEAVAAVEKRRENIYKEQRRLIDEDNSPEAEKMFAELAIWGYFRDEYQTDEYGDERVSEIGNVCDLMRGEDHKKERLHYLHGMFRKALDIDLSLGMLDEDYRPLDPESFYIDTERIRVLDSFLSDERCAPFLENIPKDIREHISLMAREAELLSKIRKDKDTGAVAEFKKLKEQELDALAVMSNMKKDSSGKYHSRYEGMSRGDILIDQLSRDREKTKQDIMYDRLISPKIYQNLNSEALTDMIVYLGDGKYLDRSNAKAFSENGNRRMDIDKKVFSELRNLDINSFCYKDEAEFEKKFLLKYKELQKFDRLYYHLYEFKEYNIKGNVSRTFEHNNGSLYAKLSLLREIKRDYEKRIAILKGEKDTSANDTGVFKMGVSDLTGELFDRTEKEKKRYAKEIGDRSIELAKEVKKYEDKHRSRYTQEEDGEKFINYTAMMYDFAKEKLAKKAGKKATQEDLLLGRKPVFFRGMFELGFLDTDLAPTEQNMIAFKQSDEYKALSVADKKEYDRMIDEYLTLRSDQDIASQTLAFMSEEFLKDGYNWDFLMTRNGAAFYNDAYTDEAKEQISYLLKIRDEAQTDVFNKRGKSTTEMLLYKKLQEFSAWRLKRGISFTKDDKHWKKYEEYAKTREAKTNVTVTLKCGDVDKKVEAFLPAEFVMKYGKNIELKVKDGDELAEKEAALNTISEKLNKAHSYQGYKHITIGGNDVVGEVRLEFNVLEGNCINDAMKIYNDKIGLEL